jgi:hypothetical protein
VLTGHVAQKEYEWQMTTREGDLLLITDHLSDPGWWQACIWQIGRHPSTVEEEEKGWVPGMDVFYSGVLMVQADMDFHFAPGYSRSPQTSILLTLIGRAIRKGKQQFPRETPFSVVTMEKFFANDDSEMSFEAGEELLITEVTDHYWTARRSSEGLVPSSLDCLPPMEIKPRSTQRFEIVLFKRRC